MLNMIFSAALVLIGGYLFGELATKIRMPKLLGMLVFGILMGRFGLGLLNDEAMEVREEAAMALGYNEHYDAIPALWSAFFDESSWFVRDLILDALEDMDQEVDEPRELLYLQEETDVDWDAIRKSLE